MNYPNRHVYYFWFGFYLAPIIQRTVKINNKINLNYWKECKFYLSINFPNDSLVAASCSWHWYRLASARCNSFDNLDRQVRTSCRNLAYPMTSADLKSRSMPLALDFIAESGCSLTYKAIMTVSECNLFYYEFMMNKFIDILQKHVIDWINSFNTEYY